MANIINLITNCDGVRKEQKVAFVYKKNVSNNGWFFTLLYRIINGDKIAELDELSQFLATLSMSITDIDAVLAIAYVNFRFTQGVWFNSDAVESCCIKSDLRERLRLALRDSFYPRPDGLFFDEIMDEKEHKVMLDKMHNQH